MDGEDTAIDEYVLKKFNGFYVDVGAHHPIQRNNTNLLFKRGWEGINIDINEFSVDLFNYLSDSSHRKRLKSLNMEDDTRFCLSPTIDSDIIPILKEDKLIIF